MLNYRNRTSWVLAIIVFAQLTGTSLWFSGNAVLSELQEKFSLSIGLIGDITTAVQVGFIVGTLTFSLLTISDRFSPSKVFFYSAFFGAVSNLSILLANGYTSLLIIRFLTGFSLAGVYPVGMKIAADWTEKKLGSALGFLVGALVMGTALPHLLKGFFVSLPWGNILTITSSLALFGGILVLLLVPDGPFQKRRSAFSFRAIYEVFNIKPVRFLAYGYFGHMWELYTFWVFVPFMITYYKEVHPTADLSVSLLSFFIIGIGGLSCVAGGYLSQKIGSHRVAFYSLVVSGTCCLLSPFVFMLSPLLFVSFLFLWGIAVIPDSPQFSTLIALHSPAIQRGTALTIINGIGFSLTIVSIQLVNFLADFIYVPYLFLFLALGPAFGILSLIRMKRQKLFLTNNQLD